MGGELGIEMYQPCPFFLHFFVTIFIYFRIIDFYYYICTLIKFMYYGKIGINTEDAGNS